VGGEFGGDEGEVVLGGGDEDIKVEEEEQGEEGDGESGVLGEEAVVVEESIGVGGAG